VSLCRLALRSNSQLEQKMQVTHATAQDIENAKAALALTAIGIAIFWRTILRMVIAIIAAGVIVLVGFGAVVFLQGMHS
jgi:predicted RND superfamily exporter protein